MAAVVRVKRRRSADPADRLVIACKRLKPPTEQDEKEETVVKEVFRFAGTINKKDESVHNHVKDALLKERLSREYKVHTPVDQRVSIRSTLVTQAKEGRFKLSLAHRAIESAEGCSPGVVGAACSLPDMAESDQILRLYDATLHESRCSEAVQQEKCAELPNDVITCNGLPMIKQKCESAATDGGRLRIEDADADGAGAAGSLESDYVYDIYYTKKDLDYCLLECVVEVEGFTDEVLFERQADDYEEVYEDEDDSNDESNWRNDYPDEDPHFYDDDSEQEGIDGLDPVLDYFTSKCDLDSKDDYGLDVDCDDGELSSEAAVRSYVRLEHAAMKRLKVASFDDSESESSDDGA